VKSSGDGVLIIGGGAAGCAAAAELSRHGIPSTIVEASERLGGLAGSHCCKSTDRCERCDACAPIDVRREVLNSANVTVLTSSRVFAAEEDGAGLLVRISRPEGVAEMRFDSVIVAIGATPFDPALDSRLGHGSVPGVLSSLEVDRAVREGSFHIPDGSSLAVVLCVGSRDVVRGAPYCSKACCKYAYHLTRHLQSANDGLAVTFFYMDWRPLDGDLSALCRWGMAGTRTVRSRPAEIVERDGRPVVRYADPMECLREDAFDMVMLAVGMLPPRDNEELAAILGVPLDDLGFFLPDNGRVLAAGCCTGPKDIDESVKEGIAAAGRAMAIMEGP
jgi:heterodisulfide reductase subunit A